jgi:acylaminoacyl-peptidase
MEAEAALLEAFSSLPSLGRGWAFPAATHDGVRVTLQLQQRNLPANAQRKYLTSFLLNEAVLEAGEVDASLPAEQQGVLLHSPSPSGRRLLVARAGSGDSAAVLELWDRGRLLRELHVPRALHGPLCNDGFFSSGRWRRCAVLRCAALLPAGHPPDSADPCTACAACRCRLVPR